MLPSALPRCPFCTYDRYRAGGGHFGGSLTQQSFTCTVCGAYAQYLSHSAGGILTLIQRSACSDPDEHGDQTLPPAYTKWVDKVMIPTWRARDEAVRTFGTAEWDRWISEQFAPQFPDCSEYPKGKWTFYDLPEAAQAFVKDTWGDTMRVGCYLPLPPELTEEVYPPQAPEIDGVRFMLRVENVEQHSRVLDGDWARGDGHWVPVDHAYSATLTPPEDPVLRCNREFFTDVWIDVGRNIERDLPPITETKNEYGGIEPWYTFTLNGNVFTVGWRKRVVSITVDAPNGLTTEDIRTVALADKVTYSAYGPSELVMPDEFAASMGGFEGPVVERIITSFRNTYPNGNMMRAGGYLDEMAVAHLLNVHAWGKEKTVEYLTILCRTVLLAETA